MGAGSILRSVAFPSLDRAQSPLGMRVATICVMMGMFMQMLDTTIANVALPYMQGSLQASRDQITWVLTSYVVALAVMTGPIGWLAARFGRREVFLISLVGFTISSMMCGLAQTLDQMIAFRLLQGAFGAALSPLSQSIILDRYPAEKRGRIMAVWATVIMVAPILGPTLGGYLTDQYSWRWVFYVNLPVGILATLGVALFLHESRPDSPPRFDWFGFGCLALMLGALQLMLDRGLNQDWFDSPEIIAEAVLTGLGLYLFVIQLFTVRHPFLNLELLKDRNYTSGLVLTFFVGLLLLATSALLPPFLQNLGGYSVMDTGILMAPRGVGTMISMVAVGRIVMKVDTRGLMLVGALILLWSMWEMSNWTPAVNMGRLAVTTLVQGIAMGLIFVPSNIYTFSTLSQLHRTDGAAVLNLVRNVGSAIGISMSTTVLTITMQVMYSQLAAHASPFNRALSINAQSLLLNPQLPFGVAQLHAIILQRSLITAYQDAFLFMFYASIPVLLVILTLRRAETLPSMPPIEAVTE